MIDKWFLGSISFGRLDSGWYIHVKDIVFYPSSGVKTKGWATMNIVSLRSHE